MREQYSYEQKEQNRQVCSDLDIFEMLSSIFVTIGKSQQILQCMREVLVTDPTFTPMSLFKYLSNNSPYISKKNIVIFLDQNNLVNNDQQTDDILKIIFSKYGINVNNNINYTGFLNFLYPFNSGILRQLLNSRVKKYQQLQNIQKNSRPSQTVITAFLLLLQEEIKVEKRIIMQTNDSRFPKKQKLKKIIKSIRKASQKSTNNNETSQNTISMTQLRNFIKAFIEVEDQLFLDLSRRLGLTKSGAIPIQNIENLLKKTKKIEWEKENQTENQLNDSQQRIRQNSKVKFDKGRSLNQHKQTKQISFRQQLYKQLANTLKFNEVPQRNRTPRAKSASKPKIKGSYKKSAQIPPVTGIGGNVYGIENLQNICIQKQVNQQNRRKQIQKNKQKTQRIKPGTFQNKPKIPHIISENNSINNLFKQFISTFLKSNKQIQECRLRLGAIGNIDYLALFKTLDNGKGVADAKSLRDFYTKLSGFEADFDFQFLIDRFGQPNQKWLSYSEFTQIFRTHNVKSDSTTNSNLNSLRSSSYHEVNGVKLAPEAIRLLSQILYLILDLEQNLRKSIRKFKKSEIQWLFSRINVDSQSKGFINYQQLKKYLTEQLHINIQMVQLMALLKRLDKSRNGVVVKEQFLII